MGSTGAGYRFTVEDLARMNPQPWDDTRYEIIDGELHVSTQPDVWHQWTRTNIACELMDWSKSAGIGVPLPAPGIVFAPDEAVAPDIGWYESWDSFHRAFGADEKLHAVDLVVEVLSPGRESQRRDRELKLDVYSRWAVKEYWLADWRVRSILVYRPGARGLELAEALGADDTLTSPLLPGFAVPLRELFPPA